MNANDYEKQPTGYFGPKPPADDKRIRVLQLEQLLREVLETIQDLTEVMENEHNLLKKREYADRIDALKAAAANYEAELRGLKETTD